MSARCSAVSSWQSAGEPEKSARCELEAGHAGDHTALEARIRWAVTPARGSRRIIELDDVDALNELPFDSVLLCRVGEVFQVKQSGLAENDRAWFALGYGDRIWRVEDVADWGPLTVLWPLPADADVR